METPNPPTPRRSKPINGHSFNYERRSLSRIPRGGVLHAYCPSQSELRDRDRMCIQWANDRDHTSDPSSVAGVTAIVGFTSWGDGSSDVKSESHHSDLSAYLNGCVFPSKLATTDKPTSSESKQTAG
jgi:hypothetical protein